MKVDLVIGNDCVWVFWTDQDVGGMIFFIEIDRWEMEWGDVDWINLAHRKERPRALVNTVKYSLVS
jgi:hypothetical protein